MYFEIILSLFAITEFTFGDNQITLVNNCREKVWVSGRPNVRVAQSQLAAGGGQTVATVASKWSGVLWGKTGCSANGGNCDSDAPSVPKPCTQAEFTFNDARSYDMYDVSNVDGSNLPISIEPTGPLNRPPNSGNTCGKAICAIDFRAKCPAQLKFVNKNRVAGCKNDRSSAARDLFLQCPNAYAFEKDDRNTFTCRAQSPGNAQYKIVFCPK